MSNLDLKIDRTVGLIRQSENIVILTGAGMSTESGIADFRSPNTGLWEKVDPYEFGNINSYIANTTKNLKFMLEMGMTMFRAKPNKGHKAITKLQKMGKLKGVITQNIDGLHQKAHTKNIVELHGTANESKCIRCHKVFPITTMINQVLKGNYAPSCEECNGLLKPNAIFFGEPLQSKTLIDADKMIEDCDLMIVLGSSLLVYPAAHYPDKAQSIGAKIVVINIQETHIDDIAEVVIHDKIADVFPPIVDRVKSEER
ncbi:MAG: NAD-dependent deacylase [Promethearchaeota archaeon]|nr:MAG: NAD-dependent deacylase [Candidatus Lokiarchaeota archaeon]